jgi:hypothetical protein
MGPLGTWAPQVRALALFIKMLFPRHRFHLRSEKKRPLFDYEQLLSAIEQRIFQTDGLTLLSSIYRSGIVIALVDIRGEP